MAVKYRSYSWIFDREAWARVLSSARPDDLEAALQLSGLSRGGLYHWMRPYQDSVFKHPSMQNFLLFCNLLELNPADFFTLEETK